MKPKKSIEIKYGETTFISSKTLFDICSILDSEVLINSRIAKICNDLHQLALERQTYEAQIKQIK
jgi:hypothetical protein